MALVGAGAHGLPLAVHAKDHGKQGVRMGRSAPVARRHHRRWETEYVETHGHLFNNSSVRPMADEVPDKHRADDDGAYW